MNLFSFIINSDNEMLKSVMRESKPIVFPSEEEILKEKAK